MISSTLVQAILGQYHLPWTGIHGPVHWARVLESGIRLAERTGAKRPVVELFAVFHDACRLNEDWDPLHGSRGADLAESFHGKFFELDDRDLIALKVACRLHTQGMTEGDVTVQTCWDADRLDLGRIGVKPSAKYLCTEAAKSRQMIEWADDRASGGHIPDLILTAWGLNTIVPS
jgi:uncharacterized protein